MPVIGYPFLAVVLDADILVFFRVDEDLFLTFLVFEANFVETIPAFGTIGLQCFWFCDRVGKEAGGYRDKPLLLPRVGQNPYDNVHNTFQS